MSDLLGGIMKGLSTLMPQEEAGTQIFKMQGEVSELKNQEKEVYLTIGKKALERYGEEGFEEEADRLKLIQSNISRIEEQLNKAKEKEEEEKRMKEEALEKRTCKECGHENPEGTKFCQECGNKLGALNCCPGCGTVNPAQVKFCQECGTKLQPAAKPVCSLCGMENQPGTRFCGGCGERLEG